MMSNEESTANTFRDRFLNVTSLGESLIEGATLGRLPSILNDFEIALLIANGKPDNYGLTDSRSVSARIRLACLRGELKAELSDRDLYGFLSEKQTYCYVHRDDARRYFSKLGLEPDAGSPLWCWLRGKTGDQAGKLKPVQQDKADFQQACLGVWKISQTTTITGDAGIVNHSDVRAYLRKYTPRTLESWAREVAPPSVKGKRGAPRKNKRPTKK